MFSLSEVPNLKRGYRPAVNLKKVIDPLRYYLSNYIASGKYK